MHLLKLHSIAYDLCLHKYTATLIFLIQNQHSMEYWSKKLKKKDKGVGK